MVGVNTDGKLVGRSCFTIGCPSGQWPAVCLAGKVTRSADDSRGTVIYSTQRIIGGQSGGAMFDAETGMLIGTTNWGPKDGSRTEALAASTWKAELSKWLPKAE